MLKLLLATQTRMQFALCNAVSVRKQRARVASNAQMHTVQFAINIEQYNNYIYIYKYVLMPHIQSYNFWGAEGAPILFSEIGFCMASCS